MATTTESHSCAQQVIAQIEKLGNCQRAPKSLQTRVEKKGKISKISKMYVPDREQLIEAKNRSQIKRARQEQKLWKRLDLELLEHQIFDGVRDSFSNFGKFTDSLPKMAESMKETAENVKESLKDFPETMKNAYDASTIMKSAMELINSTMAIVQKQTSDIFDRIKDFFDTVKMRKELIILTIVLVMFMMTQPFKMQIIPLILFIMYILGWDKVVIDRIKLIFQKTAAYLQDGSGQMITILGQVLFTIFAFLGISSIPTDKFYEMLIKRLDSIPKAAMGGMKIWEAAGKAFETVTDQFKITFLHYKKEDLIKEEGTAKEIVEWSERIFHYLQVPERTSISKDEVAVREVEALFNQMYRWKHTTAVWKSLPSESQRLIHSLTPSMQDLYRVVCKSSVHEGGPRKAPIAVLFSGDSGRGKSELLIPLSYALLHNRGIKENLKNEIYVRNYETEYWDGYVGQKIVHFDDAFQIKDSPSNPSTEFMEAIRVNNTAPAHVHCADTGDKGRFFSSEICIYTTNLKEDFIRFISSMNCPEAAVRRLNMNAFRIETKEEYEKEVTVGGVVEKRLDPTRCGWSRVRENMKCHCNVKKWNITGTKLIETEGKDPTCMAHPCQQCAKLCREKEWEEIAFCPHHYLFQRYDMLTDRSIGEPLDFSQLLTNLREYDRKLVGKETAKLDFYEQFAKDVTMFEHQVNTEEEFYDAYEYQPEPLGPWTFEEPKEEFISAALDLSVPENYLAFYQMRLHASVFEEKFGMKDNFVEMLEIELAAHPAFYNTYRRCQEFGVTNKERYNDSLVQILDEEEIVYSTRKQLYVATKRISLARSLMEWSRGWLASILISATNILEQNPVMVLVSNLSWFLTVVGLMLSFKTMFEHFTHNRRMNKVQAQKELILEDYIKNVQQIYYANHAKNEALFGSCQFGKACNEAPEQLDHMAALNILSKMCIFCCSPCQTMTRDQDLVANYKPGFDATAQIFNANLLREYWRSNKAQFEIASSVPTNVETNSSANTNLKTQNAARTEALFGPCQFRKTCATMGEVDHQAALQILASMCFFRCGPCQKMTQDPEITTNYKPGFDNETQISNAKLLLEYWRKNEAVSETNSSANANLKTVNAARTEAPSSAPNDLKTTAVAKLEVGKNFLHGMMRGLSENIALGNADQLADAEAELRKLEKANAQAKALLKECVHSESDGNFLESPRKLHHEILADANGRQVVAKLLRQSLYFMHSDTVMHGNVMFVKGTVMLMPYHYVAVLNAQNLPDSHQLHLSNMCGNKMVTFTLGDLRKHRRLMKNGNEVDAILVALDPIKTKVHVHPNIVNAFVAQKNLVNFPTNSKFFALLPSYRSMSRIDNFVVSLLTCNDVSGHFDVSKPIEISVGSEVTSYRNIYAYSSDTQFGDCGAPLVLQNPQSDSKILGIHVAAQPNQIGFSQVVTSDMILEQLHEMPLQFQMFSEPYEIVEEVHDLEAEQVDSVPLRVGLNVLGRVAQKYEIRGATQTKITPSPLFDKITEHKTIPATLHRNGPAGDPMLKGLTKFAKQVPWILPTYIKIAMSDVANNYNINVTGVDVNFYKRKLTYIEAVQGVQEEEYMAPLNRGTSLGFPYVIEFSHPKGKREAFGDEEWIMDSPQALRIEEDVKKLEDSCRKGIQRGVYWTDTLKDERRPIAKVKAGKTRVFCAGPVHFTILFRMYFLGFAAWIMKNRNVNEIATGTNVYSMDWHIIAQKLQSRGKNGKKTNIVAGDFENFDGSLSSQVLWAIFESIQEWYDDGPENAQIRRTLWTHIVHAIHLNGRNLYSATHSQPSGCPITAILNSIYNSAVIRIVYLLAALEEERKQGFQTGILANMTRFNEFVACISYGDDNLIAIMESIKEWFNQITITEKFKVIGHVYTDERKTGEVYFVRDLSEVAFLKRQFHWNHMLQRYIAPLDLDVVLEIVQWTKRGMQRDEITLANIDVAMRELSLHGEEIFSKYREELKRACIESKINYRFKTYLEYFAQTTDTPIKFEVEEWGSIWDEKDYIVHCVSADMKMSRGFAKTLVEQRLTEKEHLKLKRGKHRMYEPVFHESSKTIHLVTKHKFFHKPKDTLLFERALRNLNTACVARGIKRIVMPPMQCGLDAKFTHLKIDDLKALLNRYLTIEWQIYA